MKTRTEPIKYKIVNLRRRRPWHGRKVQFPWVGWKNGLEITIYCRTAYDADRGPGRDVIERYEVNWGALGATTPDQARVYARAIIVASREADRLTRKYKGREDLL